MGSTPSKTTAIKTALNATTPRKYPQRIPPHPSRSPSSPTPSTLPTPPQPPPNAPKPNPSDPSTALDDGSDPAFARSLRSLGPVTPSSTLSHSSTFNFSPPTSSSSSSSSSSTHHHPRPDIFPNPALNPAIQILAARTRLAEEAEAEFALGRGGMDGDADGDQRKKGRRVLDVVTLRRVLVLRDGKGLGPEEIERRMGLGSGVVGRLGGRGVVGEIGGGGGGL